MRSWHGERTRHPRAGATAALHESRDAAPRGFPAPELEYMLRMELGIEPAAGALMMLHWALPPG